MMIFEACFEQSIFSIHDDPAGCCRDSSWPSLRKLSTSCWPDAGSLLLIQFDGPSPSAPVSCVTSCGFIQYTPGLDGSLVPYLS
ncbi:hypothetical protein D3C83_46020 [compost metagenome]